MHCAMPLSIQAAAPPLGLRGEREGAKERRSGTSPRRGRSTRRESDDALSGEPLLRDDGDGVALGAAEVLELLVVRVRLVLVVGDGRRAVELRGERGGRVSRPSERGETSSRGRGRTEATPTSSIVRPQTARARRMGAIDGSEPASIPNVLSASDSWRLASRSMAAKRSPTKSLGSSSPARESTSILSSSVSFSNHCEIWRRRNSSWRRRYVTSRMGDGYLDGTSRAVPMTPRPGL